MAIRTFRLFDPLTNEKTRPADFKDFVLEHIKAGVIHVQGDELFNDLAKKRGDTRHEFNLIIREIHFGEYPQLLAMDSQTRNFCIIRLDETNVYLELTE